MSEAVDETVPLQESDSQISLLMELMGEINRGAGMHRVFSLIGETLRRFFAIDRFAVSLISDDGLPHIVASDGLSTEYIHSVNGDLSNTPGVRTMENRKPLYLLDAPAAPDFAPFQEAAAREGFHTVLFFPLYSGQDPLGFLVMYHNTIRPYSPPELALAQALATQAGVAMAQARLLDDVEAQRHELERQYATRAAEAEAIDMISLQIASSLDLDDTFRSIVAASAELTGGTTSALYLRTSQDEYRSVASYGVPVSTLDSVVLTRKSGLLSRMVHTGEPVQVVNFSEEVPNASDAARSYVQDAGVQSTLGVPLMQGRECIGALYVARLSQERFPDDAVRVMKRFAAFAQVAVRNAEQFTWVQSERERLQGYIDAIPEGVIVFDGDGTIVLTNGSLLRDLQPQREMVGRNNADVFEIESLFADLPVRFRFDHHAAFARVLERGEAEQGLVEVGAPPRMFEINYSPMALSNGRAGGVLATLRDITSPLDLERERARTHLFSELLSLSVLLNSDLSIAVLIERVVDAAMALVGASAGTLGLVEGDRLVFRRYRTPEGWADFDVQVGLGEGAPGHVWKTAMPHITNDSGADRFVLQNMRKRLGFRRLVFVPVFDRRSRVIGTLGVYDPVVERDFGRQDLEALQLLAHQAAIAIENARLNEVKDEFLSIVSHELKTPVTSIKGFTQILQRRLADGALDTTRRYLDVINHQADRLTGLINDLLDLSRIQTGRFVFAREQIDYGQLVRDVLMETRLVSPGNAITYTGPEHLQAEGNANRLRQVLVNLIDNGIKHGPANGALHVTVEAKGDLVYTYVCDEGPGLPPAERERIFAQYYQVRHGSEHQARGLGLGLFISRQIVEEHGGKIWLDPADHTSFCFTVERTRIAPSDDTDVYAHGMTHRTISL
jgi:signal transduction histidine kinase